MKGLFIAHCNDLSGANKSFLSNIDKLKDRIDIVVLINKKEGLLSEELRKRNIPMIYHRYGWWYALPRKNFFKRIYRITIDFLKYKTCFLDKKFIANIESYNFDFIYTNTSTVDIGARISQKLKIPHFWHIREFGKEDFSFISLVSSKYRYKMFLNAKKIIVISDALKRKYIKILKNKGKVTRIYNGFDVDKLLASKRHHDLDSGIVLLITGQVCEGKGQEQAIEATNDLYHQGYPIKLILAGGVDSSYIKPVLRRYSDFDEWLEILGQVENVYKLRNQVDIELICSRSEAFGRVTLEAMLHSIPVIGSNTGGTKELIINEKNGLLYEYGNIKNLEECIINLIKNGNLYNTIINNEQKFAKEFTIEETSNQLYSLFKSIDD